MIGPLVVVDVMWGGKWVCCNADFGSVPRVGDRVISKTGTPYTVEVVNWYPAGAFRKPRAVLSVVPATTDAAGGAL